jgi:hypothetical protein
MRLIIAVIVLLVSGCSDEPLTPSNVSLIGTWEASNWSLFALSDLKVIISQQDTGIVRGRWTARGSGGNGGCDIGKPCDAFGNLIGRNTISTVELEVLGAGRFDGRLVEPNRLRGTYQVDQSYDTITFIRTSLTPPANSVAR